MAKFMNCRVEEIVSAARHFDTIYLDNEPRPRSILEYGYAILHKDGTRSWLPKEKFDAHYVGIKENISLSEEMVNLMIKQSEIQVSTLGDKTTLVYCKLPNGFVLTESSSCVDPINYDEEMGKEICMQKITDRLWELLGFTLQTSKQGFFKYD